MQDTLMSRPYLPRSPAWWLDTTLNIVKQLRVATGGVERLTCSKRNLFLKTQMEMHADHDFNTNNNVKHARR
jgi:hypothetical protein